jgi:hypothetical protein
MERGKELHEVTRGRKIAQTSLRKPGVSSVLVSFSIEKRISQTFPRCLLRYDLTKEKYGTVFLVTTNEYVLS